MNKLIIKKKAFGIILGAFFFCGSHLVQAQTIDSTNQKPQLNNELPGMPVPATAPERPAPAPSPVTEPTPAPATRPESEPAPAPAPRPAVQKSGDDEETSWKDNVFVGSTGGLGFGSNSYSGTYFYLSASPFVGYRILDRLAVGPGITYEYTGTNGYHLSTYGGKLFSQISVYKGFLLHAEHEILSVADLALNNSNQVIETRRRINSTLAGGGYRQMNGNFGMDFYVLFNLNNDLYQYRSNPVVRVGFIYNLKRSRD